MKSSNLRLLHEKDDLCVSLIVSGHTSIIDSGLKSTGCDPELFAQEGARARLEAPPLRWTTAQMNIILEQHQKPRRQVVLRCQKVIQIFRNKRSICFFLGGISMYFHAYSSRVSFQSDTRKGTKTISVCNIYCFWKTVAHAWVWLMHGSLERGEAGCSFF